MHIMNDDGATTTETTGGAPCDREPIPTPAAPRMPANRNLRFAEAVSLLRDVAKCPTCGKSTGLFNVGAYRRPVIERVDPAIHCACVGGPAYAGIGSTR